MNPDVSAVVSEVDSASRVTLFATNPPSNDVVTKIERLLSFSSSSRKSKQPLTVSP